MNGKENSDSGIHEMSREVREKIYEIIQKAPQLSMPIIQMMYKIATTAFDAGVEAGLNNAIVRIEETNSKIQSLSRK